ncbi:MAG: DNA polymerase I [Patescibacteria group bacterium]|nr:DNA polymerase I [Patescibacteria group bacterium]
MAKGKEKLIIIDGNALIHRSFHALPPTLRTKDGELVNAVYGFSAVLLKAWRELKPDYIALTLDMKGPTFRHKQYKEYKATRIKAPQDLYDQIPRVKEVATAFNIPIFELQGFEADDLIGTIDKKVDASVEKIIVTGDLDTLQLIDDDTKIFTMGHGLSESVVYDAARVKERYGLTVDQMIDYKALRGDPSDNIPGVKGIGEKTATKLLQEFGTLENLYKKLQISNFKFQISPRVTDLLIKHKKDAFLSKELATIRLDVPIKFDLEKCRAYDFDREKVAGIFSELGFKSLLPRVQDLVSAHFKVSDKSGYAKATADKFERDRTEFKYILVDDDKKFAKFLAALSKQKQFTIDTETTGFDPLLENLLGISFSWRESEAYFIVANKSPLERGGRPLAGQGVLKVVSQSSLFKDDKKESTEKNNHPWLEKLKSILEDEKIKKCGHNIKFDLRVLRHAGIEMKGIEFDTMVASYLLNPGTRAHNLDAVTFAELGLEKISTEDLLGSGKDKKTFAAVETEKLAIYSCEDADCTNRLVAKLAKHLRDKELSKLFEEIEMPLVSVLATMEDNGVMIDKDFLAAMDKKIAKKISTLEKKIWDLGGGEFNINSTQQLKEVLFEKLNISTAGIGHTKTGYSTAADELEKLKHEHEIIPLIQEYRELAKLQSTYILALPTLINPVTGRVHTSFNQTVTATGRLSSSDPNLQNIPIRTELGQEIRHAFIAQPGWKIVSLDYSQIELRLAAHLSGDQRMIDTFERSLDIHTSTAAAINNVKIEDVTKKMRQEAKAINFGILYGQGAYGLSQNTDMPLNRAKEFIEHYFDLYKNIKTYTEDMVEFARKNGYVETLFGRRRYLPEITSQVAPVRAAAERMAVNTPLQGTNADMIKKAMISAQNLIDEKYSDSVKMIIQVHDELVFEMREDKMKEAAGRIQDIMRDILKLKVPVVVDIEIGESWGEMNRLENKK